MNDSIDKALDDLDDLDFNESIVKVVFILKCTFYVLYIVVHYTLVHCTAL